jgi:hypothetical protein
MCVNNINCTEKKQKQLAKIINRRIEKHNGRCAQGKIKRCSSSWAGKHY